MKLSSLNYIIGGASGVLVAIPPLQVRVGPLPTSVYYLVTIVIIVLSVVQFPRDLKIPRTKATILFFWMLFVTITLVNVARVNSVDVTVFLSFTALSLITILLGVAGIDEKTIKGFVFIVVSSACIVGLLTIVNYWKLGDFSGYSKEARLGYLTVGAFLGTALIIVAWNFLCTRKLFYLVLTVWLMLCLALSQGRGPLVFGIFVVGYMYLTPGTLKRLGASRNMRRLLPIASVSIFLVVAYQGLRVDRLRDRLFAIFTDFGSREGAGSRVDIFSRAFEKISDAPIFGHGFGEYTIKNYLGLPITPHNFILQVMLDSGVVGIIPLLIAIGMLLKKYLTIKRQEFTNFAIPMFFVFVFQILNACKSYDFYLSRSFFIVMAFLIGALSFRRVRP